MSSKRPKFIRQYKLMSNLRLLCLFMSATLLHFLTANCSGYGQYYKNLSKTLVDIKGDVVWARSTETATGTSEVRSVAVDNNGNVYAGGNIGAGATISLGNGISLTNPVAGSDSIFFSKYDETGTPLWAKTLNVGSGLSQISGVCLSASGSIYAVGIIFGTGNYDFGTGIFNSDTNTANNSFIARFNESGDAIWVKTVNGADSDSVFNDCRVDASGNVYVAGYIGNSGTFDFGNGSTLPAPAGASFSHLVVKYDADGNAFWARTSIAATGSNLLFGSAVDESGNVYVAGTIAQGTVNFGNSITATGLHTGGTGVVVRYDTSGNTIFAHLRTGVRTFFYIYVGFKKLLLVKNQ